MREATAQLEREAGVWAARGRPGYAGGGGPPSARPAEARPPTEFAAYAAYKEQKLRELEFMRSSAAGLLAPVGGPAAAAALCAPDGRGALAIGGANRQRSEAELANSRQKSLGLEEAGGPS